LQHPCVTICNCFKIVKKHKFSLVIQYATIPVPCEAVKSIMGHIYQRWSNIKKPVPMTKIPLHHLVAFGMTCHTSYPLVLKN
jgi:hypothetical protein